MYTQSISYFDKICTRTTALFRESRNIKLHEIVDSFDFSETTPEMKAFFEGRQLPGGGT